MVYIKEVYQLRLPFLDKQTYIFIFLACLIFILTLWYDSSPASYNSYNTICASNYGKIEEYNDCMKPFYNQLNMDRIGMAAASIVLFISTIILIVQRLRKPK